MKKNEIIEIRIESVSTDGNGIGKFDGNVVFVPFSALGDLVRVKIIKANKSFCVGKIEKILEEGKGRVEADCPVFFKCGGCALRHVDYETECDYKSEYVKYNLKKLGRLTAKVEPTIGGENREGYRNKSMIPVREGENGEILYGFFAARSHRLISSEECLIQPQIFSKIARFTAEFFEDHKIKPYCEETGTGILRNIYLRTSNDGKIMLCLVVTAHFDEKDEFTKSVVSKFSEIETVLINVNRRRDNVLLGDEYETLYGNGYIEDTLLGYKFKISPASFYQINHKQTERLYSLVSSLAAPEKEDTVLDLYCGIGTIGLTMAKKVKKLIGIEIVPAAIDNAKENARINGVKNAEFICADAGTGAKMMIERGEKIDTVIVDPPRKGCDKETIEAIKTINPEKIVMVSCNSATLARDLAALSEFGYKIGTVYPLDMFPGTVHVETVALLSRQKVDEHIYFDVNVQDLPKTARTTATYPEIKAYVKDKYGLNVTSLNIAQVKEKHGFEKRENYNKGKDGHRVPNCPPEKEKAIEDAFKHFGML